MEYETRYHVNSRGEDYARHYRLGQGRQGHADGEIREAAAHVELPAQTLLPITLRDRVIDAMAADPGKPKGPLNLRSIELGRFFSPLDLTLTPTAAIPPLPLPKGAKPPPPIRSPLLRGSATLRQTSKALAEWMESTVELTSAGVVPRFLFRREGLTWRAEMKEMNAFPNPTCGG